MLISAAASTGPIAATSARASKPIRRRSRKIPNTLSPMRVSPALMLCSGRCLMTICHPPKPSPRPAQPPSAPSNLTLCSLSLTPSSPMSPSATTGISQSRSRSFSALWPLDRITPLRISGTATSALRATVCRRRWRKTPARWTSIPSPLCSIPCARRSIITSATTTRRLPRHAAPSSNILGIRLHTFGSALREKKMYKDALEQFSQGRKLSGDHPVMIALYGHTLALSGDAAGARRALADLHGLAQSRYVSSLYFAAVYLGLGDNHTALDWLDRAYKERNDRLLYLAAEPMADPLRSEPRFTQLLAKVGVH